MDENLNNSTLILDMHMCSVRPCTGLGQKIQSGEDTLKIKAKIKQVVRHCIRSLIRY